MTYVTELTQITLVVVAALLGGIGFTHLRQPPILGYILAGVILGPSGVGLIQCRDYVSTLAELGVLMLLFVIGMELNLRTFKKVWVISTLCMLLQIGASVAIIFIMAEFFGWSLSMSLLLGFVMSLSSTAVVFKMLESINEIKTDAGQLTIGVLIAQDLAIIPMILILRNLNRHWLDPVLISKLLIAIGLTVGLIIYLSRRQRVHIPLTTIIAGEKDLIPLASLTFCFGGAAISGLIGLSAAYGAFLAGLVLGNSHERLAMFETAKPIQSTLLMIFFLSIGLLLDLSFIWQNLKMVLSLLLLITIGKTALNIFILRILRLPWPQAFLIGVILAQLGEFAFLLTTIGHGTKIINQHGENLIIALTVLSLSFSPLWLSTARRLKASAGRHQASLGTILSQVYGKEVLRLRRLGSNIARLFLWSKKTSLKEDKTQSSQPHDK